MTVDERLDQLEPLLSEALTVLDRHTYQLKQLSTSVSQLTTAVVQQGDNISFLLREQLAMRIKQDAMEGTQNDMNGKLDQIIQLLQKPGK
jgi:ABC-type transporter Mla subunit MlaD